jgi:hypothetical protein
VVKPGHIFTIEPMINLGSWQVRGKLPIIYIYIYIYIYILYYIYTSGNNLLYDEYISIIYSIHVYMYEFFFFNFCSSQAWMGSTHRVSRSARLARRIRPPFIYNLFSFSEAYDLSFPCSGCLWWGGNEG